MPTGTHAVTVAGEDISCLVESVGIQHGRDSSGGQPDASSCTLELNLGLGPLPAAVDVGAAVSVTTTTPAGPFQRFQGKVTDLHLGWEEAGADTPEAGTGQLIAIGTLADLGRRIVGDAPYPQEPDGARVSRVLAAAGVVLDPLYSDPGTVQILARDIDSQPALNVAQGAAESASGVIWQTRAGEIRYADANHRKNATPQLTLDACDLLVTPTWRRNTEGLVNEVSVGYGVVPEGGEQPRYVASSPSSVAKFGHYAYTATTELAALADAQALGELWLARNSSPVWVMAALPVAIAELDQATYEQLLALDMHALVNLTGLPAIGAAPTSAPCWVEGWSETLTYGSHELTLVVSGYCRTSPPPRWDDVDPGWVWGGSTHGAELRRNRVPNPKAANLNGWGGSPGSGGAAGLSQLAAGGPLPEAPSFVRFTWTVAATAANPYLGVGAATATGYEIAVLPGEVGTFSMYVRTSVAGQTFRPQVNHYTSAGAYVSSWVGANVVLPAGSWQRISVNGTVPATGARAVLYAQQVSGTFMGVGATLDTTAALWELGAALGSWFDGSSTDPAEFDYWWTALADASPSAYSELVASVPGLPASLTWDEAACLGPPVNLGRWDDQPASLRWDQLAPTITWNNYGG